MGWRDILPAKTVGNEVTYDTFRWSHVRSGSIPCRTTDRHSREKRARARRLADQGISLHLGSLGRHRMHRGLLTMKKTSRPHWYLQHIGECPGCGRDTSFRVRVYGQKPEDPEDRYVHLSNTQTYDQCLERAAL